MVREDIQELLDSAITKLGLPVPSYEVEHPADLAHGDYAANCALVLAKEVGQSPREVAERIVAACTKPEWLGGLEVAGPGFINIYLARTFFRDEVRRACTAADTWGSVRVHAGNKVMVEHTQPNPFKPRG